ncbi:hypothetical protein M3647_21150 [Paenibacillus cellulositrophicus]|uniref:hypothetical protein n=1 Tax=Paenibacillus cellulositrophicus TaxID=562959 RepID=UPI00203BB6FC|nr:hypothetical protein [Paenibacillus cellulositrophicus]MCM2999986.1 hypothetical protein [Paenibacillus cellulositrophicus]
MFKNKRGYVSIETVIVAGLAVALGAYALTEFYTVAQGTTAVSMEKINSAMDVGEVILHPHTDGPPEEVELP